MERYSIITDKNPREIVLLRGRGCVYQQCAFCDYHLDRCDNEQENFLLNRSVLERITGLYHNLEVINSGSVFELDDNTLRQIKQVCKEKNIHTIHFEAHYLYKDKIRELRRAFSGFDLKMKLGLETFDTDFRESVLKKGIAEDSPEVISREFDEANLLFGITGQTEASMRRDIELGLRYFERICINLMCENTTDVRPDRKVLDTFVTKLYPMYQENDRVDVLINNTDFGVGE